MKHIVEAISNILVLHLLDTECPVIKNNTSGVWDGWFWRQMSRR
jgi:hypothetical protein